MHAKHGVRCADRFDEFQDVLVVATHAGAILRSVIEQHYAEVAGYMFSGSHIGMMRELFADRERPFYGQATRDRPAAPRADELAEYIARPLRPRHRDRR